MIRKLTALVAACAVVFTAIAPTAAEARRHRDGYYERHYDHRYRRHNDNDEAVAAGVVGLVLGLAIGSMASQNNEPRYRCRDNYQRCAPPPQQDRYYQDQRYQQDDRYYDDRGAYRGRGGSYEEEYGLEGGEGSYDPRYEDSRTQCTRRERQWDRYAERYVTVDVPC